ncbi:hypothetical protein ACFE04_029309 [Oxalis oulophora]
MAGKGEGSTIGIGLGTTYSCVGVLKHDRVKKTANDEGNKTTPSYVRFTNTGEVFESLSKYCFLLHVQQGSPDASKYESSSSSSPILHFSVSPHLTSSTPIHPHH